MNKWAFSVRSRRGNIHDISDCARLLDSSEMKIIYDFEHDSTPYGHLTSRHLDSLVEPRMVEFRAKQLINVLNGCMILRNVIHLLEIETLYQVGTNSELHVSAYYESPSDMVAGSKNSLPTFDSKLSLIQHSNRNQLPLSQLVLLARQFPEFSEACRLFGSPNLSFQTLYKVYEKLKAGLNSKKSNVLVKLKIEDERFRRTTQDVTILGDEARHGTFDKESVKNPMSLAEARDFIIEIGNKYIDIIK